MNDKDMWGRTRYKHGRKRGVEFTCGEAAKIIALSAIAGTVLVIIINIIREIL